MADASGGVSGGWGLIQERNENSVTRIQLLLKLIFNDKLIIDYFGFSLYLCGVIFSEK